MAIDYNKLAGMSTEDAIAYLSGLSDFSKITPGTYNWAEQTEGSNPAVQTPWGSYAYPVLSNPYNGEGVPQLTGWRSHITNQFDPTYDGGEYGSYVGTYDPTGQLTGVEFEQNERSGGWLAENLEWAGPLLVGIAGWLGSTYGLSAAAAQEAAAPITESLISNLGPNASLQDSIAYLVQNGIPAAEAQTIMQAAATDVLTGTMGNVSGTLPAWVTQAAQSLPGGPGGLLNDIPGGATPAPTTPGTTPPATGTPTPPVPGTPTLPNLGNVLGGLANAGVNFAAANEIKDKLFDLGDEMEGKYQPALDYLKSKGTFTPYAMRSPFASTDNAGNADVDQVYKDILSGSNPVAQQSFAAAGDFDYEQNAQDEYNLMMQILNPEFERQQLATEARMAKQGRLGMSEAPELTALEKAQAEQSLKAMLAARSTGLERRGAMINQGNAAMNPTMGVWQALQNQQQLSNQTGAQAGQLGNQSANTWAHLFDRQQQRAFDYKNAGTQVVADAITGAARPIGNAVQQGVQAGWEWLWN